MDLLSIAVIATGFLYISIFSSRIQDTPVTPPMLLIGFGFLIGNGALGVANLHVGHSTTHLIAEFTLMERR